MHHRKEITNFGTSLAKRTPYFGTSYVGKITRFGISLLEKLPIGTSLLEKSPNMAFIHWRNVLLGHFL
jgi:hypothetical protein